jgi:hypothetical protein
MSGVWQEAELSMQENDRIAFLQEVLSGCGSAGASGEIVNETDGLVFERDGRASRGDQDNPSVWGIFQMVLNEFSSKRLMFGQSFGRGVVLEVCILSFFVCERSV